MTDQQFRFETGAATHQGCVRDHNEDRYLVLPERGLWLVADGMGGHYGGEFAASTIVTQLETIGRASSAPDLQARFVDRIAAANAAIQRHSRESHGVTIGATVAALLTYGTHFACVWSGDSRAYLLRDGQLSQISRDHTEVQDLLDSGAITLEQAENWPRKNVITRAIGVREEAQLDHIYGTLRDRDLFLLCSDGLTGHVADDELPAALAGVMPQAACDALVARTLDRGASDNVTVIAVRCAVKTRVGAMGGMDGAAWAVPGESGGAA